MKVEDEIKKRHSVRNFKETKKAKWQDVVKAIDAANYAPSAGNIPTLKFIFVNEPEKIAKLTEGCQQYFIAKASCIVVVCSDTTQIERSYGERAKKYARQQAGAAIQNFLLEITALGLGSCWVGAFNDDEVKRVLKIPDNIGVEAILPVGYEIGKSKIRKKPDLDNIIFFNEWKNKYLKPKKKPEAR